MPRSTRRAPPSAAPTALAEAEQALADATGERAAAASDLEAADAELERARAAAPTSRLDDPRAGYTGPHGSTRLDRIDQLRPGERAGEGVHARCATTTSTSTSSTRRPGARSATEGVGEVRQGGRRRRHRDGLRGPQGPLRHVRQGRAEGAATRRRPGRSRSPTSSPSTTIDPIYYERTYWLAPDGDAAKKAYGLLLAAMEDRDRVGIGTRGDAQQAVPHRHPAARRRAGHVDDALRRRGRARAGHRRHARAAAKPDAKALKHGDAAASTALGADWKPKRYHDTYTEELRKRIKAKDTGKGKKVADDAPAEEGLGQDRRPHGRPGAERRGRQGPHAQAPAPARAPDRPAFWFVVRTSVARATDIRTRNVRG